MGALTQFAGHFRFVITIVCWLGSTCCLAAANTSQAHDIERGCAGASDLNLDANQETLARVYDELLLQQECATHPNPRIASSFLALQGAILRRLGRYDQSILVLERSLMLNADRADALLEFGLANDAVGDLSTALSIYQLILTQLDPPPAVQHLLLARIAALQVGYPDRRIGPMPKGNESGGTKTKLDRNLVSMWQSIQQGIGFDHNVNAAIKADRLMLSLADGVVELPLAESELRKSAMFYQLEYRLGARWPFDGGDLSFQQRISHRQPLTLPEFRNTQIQSEISWEPDGSRGASEVGRIWLHRFAFGAQHLDLGGETLLRGIRLEWLAKSKLDTMRYVDWSQLFLKQTCKSFFGLDLDARHYPQRNTLDGWSGSLQSKLLCDTNNFSWQLALRMGRDLPINDRPGGSQRRREFSGLLMWKDRPFVIISDEIEINNSLQITFTQQDDEKGYNPLINNNSIRNLSRLASTLERGARIGKFWELVSALEIYRQGSNLPLFDAQGWTATLKFRRHW